MKSLIVFILIVDLASYDIRSQDLTISNRVLTNHLAWNFSPGNDRIEYLPQKNTVVSDQCSRINPLLVYASKGKVEKVKYFAAFFQNERNQQDSDLNSIKFRTHPFFNFNTDILVTYRLLDYPNAEINLPPIPVSIFNSRIEGTNRFRLKSHKIK